MKSHTLVFIVCLVLSARICVAQTSPKVVLYHSFDGAIEKADYSAGPIEVSANDAFTPKTPAISGKAAWFDARDPEASLRIDMKDLLKGDSWTISLWTIFDIKDWLSAPQDNLLTLLDADGEPVLRLTKSGDVLVYEDGKELHQDCFDALYWVRRSREHLTLTWDAAGSGVSSPAGILRAFWKARPYAALAIDLKRKPVFLQIGHAASGYGVDDLYAFDSALPLRSIWELMRRTDGDDIKGLEKMLAERGEIEAKRPTAIRTAAWAEKMKSGIVVEAEANPGESKVVVCPVPNKDEDEDKQRLNAFVSAATASGSAHVEPGANELTFKVNIKEAGKYALALRYCARRKIIWFWPQNTTAKTPWTENYGEVEVRLDGGKQTIGNKVERLYPPGVSSGHGGDVEMWALHAVNGGKKVKLSAGEHTVTIKSTGGVQPQYDALLLTADAVATPPHPRWVDLYRIPPAWWIDGHKTEIKGGKRIDTYDVLLRNRCDEPCSYEIIAGPDMMVQQKVGVRAKAGDPVTQTCRVALKPYEHKSFQVVFETPEKITGNSEWANIYLWNDDVALRQKYRVWNVIRDPVAAARPHPRMIPLPDPEKQAKFREWLKTRDPKTFTPELRDWSQGYPRAVIQMAGAAEWFRGGMSGGGEFEALDAWMSMSAAEIDEYLPDGPAESNGYGRGWDRVGVAYGGIYHSIPRITRLEPEGDIDFVTSMIVDDKPQKDKTEPYHMVYTVEKDPDVMVEMRNVRWSTIMGDHIGGAPYKDTVLTRQRNVHVGMIIDAYYLTGDPAYARKAVEMLKIMAWKYTSFTKHSQGALHREDRDWWGGRVGGRYQFKTGSRYYLPLGVQALDVMWDVLTPEERTMIEHNVIRWGMYEGMAGPLWELPTFYAAVNREDMPFMHMGKVLDDPAPVNELDFYFDLFKDILHPDGIHICGIGGYGSVGGYATFMQKMEEQGFEIKNDPALRNLFTAQPSFIFSGGGVPTPGDGGGVNIQGMGAGSGCANAEQYAWAKKLFGDPLLDEWPKLIHAAGHLGKNKMEGMRTQYLASGLPVDKLWPPVYIAPVAGLAMLRNKTSSEPIDWVEVLFDYGKFGGRAHGHAAKLATVPSFNGQIVSMEYGYGMHGQPVAGGFHVRSYAHNVVLADGKSQFGAISPVQVGELRESHSEETLQWIDADSSRIYKDIYMRRTLFTTDFGIVDLYLSRAEKEHQYDWMFHSFGVAGTDEKLKPVAKNDSEGPLTFGVNPRSAVTKKTVQVTWENAPITQPPKKSNTALLHEKAFVRVHAVPSGDTEIRLFGIPITENCGSEIDYMMLRRNAKSTVFATVQEPWRESSAPKVRSLRSLPVKAGKKPVDDSDAYALEVTRMNGVKEVFFVNYAKGPKTVGRVITDARVAYWKVAANGAVSGQAFTDGAAFRVR